MRRRRSGEDRGCNRGKGSSRGNNRSRGRSSVTGSSRGKWRWSGVSRESIRDRGSRKWRGMAARLASGHRAAWKRSGRATNKRDEGLQRCFFILFFYVSPLWKQAGVPKSLTNETSPDGNTAVYWGKKITRPISAPFGSLSPTRVPTATSLVHVTSPLKVLIVDVHYAGYAAFRVRRRDLLGSPSGGWSTDLGTMASVWW